MPSTSSSPSSPTSSSWSGFLALLDITRQVLQAAGAFIALAGLGVFAWTLWAGLEMRDAAFSAYPTVLAAVLYMIAGGILGWVAGFVRSLGR